MDAIFVNTTLSGIQQRNLEVSSRANSVFFVFWWTEKLIFSIAVLNGRECWESQSWTVWVL